MMSKLVQKGKSSTVPNMKRALTRAGIPYQKAEFHSHAGLLIGVEKTGKVRLSKSEGSTRVFWSPETQWRWVDRSGSPTAKEVEGLLQT